MLNALFRLLFGWGRLGRSGTAHRNLDSTEDEATVELASLIQDDEITEESLDRMADLLGQSKPDRG